MLCVSCSRLEIQRLPQGSRHLPPKGYHLGTLGDICERSKACDFCQLIKEFLLNGQAHRKYVTVDGVADEFAHLQVVLRRGIDDGIKLSNIGLALEPNGLDFSFQLYALRGSPAIRSDDVVERDLCMTLDPKSLRPSYLVRKWLDRCISGHAKCRKAFIGDYAETERSGVVAARLLRISQPGLTATRAAVPSVRLVETGRHFEDEYVCLSHCWGPDERKPVCTTSENVDAHMIEVPWGRLPQTFKDACTLCSELGISYLWIDSLCIVQNDDKDWREQAAVMGRIYQESLFTIAASSAPDSTYGLFNVRLDPKMVKLPYRNHSGEDGSLYAYRRPSPTYLRLEEAPISKRAWVLQEYVLSRRTVHFTSHGVVWSCSRNPALIVDEFGTDKVVIPDNWIEMVMQYSRRRLTRKSDKLVAIQGLANMWADHYRKRYYYGIFLDDLPFCLLWSWDSRMKERLVRDVGCGIPSWTWASTTGPVDFEQRQDGVDSYSSICGDITPSETFPGALMLRTVVKPISSTSGPFNCLPRYSEDLRMVDPGSADLTIPRDWCNHSNHTENCFLLMDASGVGVGVGLFDEETVPNEPLWCLPLAKAPSRPWYMPPVDTSDPFFLWSLLVKQVVIGEHEVAFSRVGHGRVQDTSWIESEPERDLYLV